MLVAERDYDEVVFAVCAPDAYARIWRRFREFSDLFSDTEAVTIRQLPAEVVARRHPDGGSAFARRYAPVLNDDALLHLDTSGSTLLGVWVHRDGHAVSHYPDDGPNEVSGNRSYAEAVLSGGARCVTADCGYSATPAESTPTTRSRTCCLPCRLSFAPDMHRIHVS